MASSLIRINEATGTELQQLRGIGPKRAEYILAYISDVGPIRNAFDLATATGISVKHAEQMTKQIDWDGQIQQDAVHVWPLILTTAGTIWLLSFAFTRLALDTSSLPTLLISLSLLAVLAGGILLSADIAVASMLKLPSETTKFFKAAAMVFGAGLTLLLLLGFSSVFVEYEIEFKNTLEGVLLFVVLALTMTWLLYGPSLMLRALVAAAPDLNKASLLYDLSAIPIVLGSGTALAFYNRETWIEEIFAVWILAVVTTSIADLYQGRTAFSSMLSDLDRSRYRFVLRHEMDVTPTSAPRKTIAIALTAAAITTLAVLGLGFTPL